MPFYVKIRSAAEVWLERASSMYEPHFIDLSFALIGKVSATILRGVDMRQVQV